MTSTESSAPQSRKSALAFAALFSIESFCRSVNATVLSVQAYDILGSSAKVSQLSVAVSLAVLTTTLLLPVAFGVLRRRWAYTIGIAGVLLAALSLSTFTIEGQVIGTYLRNAAAALLNITLSLYIMDHIKRHELVRSESLRLTLSTLSWMAGPAFGIALYEQLGPEGPQRLVIATGLLLFSVFWFLKLTEPELLPAGTIQNKNPLRYIKRYISQPRLRLAWIIAFGRSCYWATLFIYGPLVLIEAGASKQFAGLVISLSQAALFTAYLYGHIAQATSVRLVVTLCLVVTGISSMAAGLTGAGSPVITAGLLLAGAFACVGLDAVGGVPFLRAVKPRERRTMAAIYRTFIELSELLPAIIFAFVLTIFATPVVFLIIGAFLFVVAGIAWQHLPKSM